MFLDVLQSLANFLLWFGLVALIPGVIIGTIMLARSSKKEDGTDEKKKLGKRGVMFIFIPMALAVIGGIAMLLIAPLRVIF